MELDFVNNMDGSYDSYEERYQELMVRTFKVLSIKQNYVVEVDLIDNQAIHQINKNYRKVDRPTDVISFAFLDNLKESEKIKGKRVPIPLGEIIISTEKAEEQAKGYGHSLQREMSFLFVHGLLHLLGYDHTKGKDEEKEMFDLQDKILDLDKKEN
jgi:probable rRNA maturation factor